jgi:hypothetical protein
MVEQDFLSGRQVPSIHMYGLVEGHGVVIGVLQLVRLVAQDPSQHFINPEGQVIKLGHSDIEETHEPSAHLIDAASQTVTSTLQ